MSLRRNNGLTDRLLEELSWQGNAHKYRHVVRGTESGSRGRIRGYAILIANAHVDRFIEPDHR